MLASTGAVLIVAPPTLHRQGLLLTLQQVWPVLDFMLTADSSRVPDLLRSQAYQLVVVDGQLPDLRLRQLLEMLLMARACQHLLLLTSRQQTLGLRQTLRNTRRLALLPRYSPPEAMLVTIRQLLEDAGGRHSEWSVARQPSTPFSPRELEVLRLVVAGCCNQEIAERLYLNVRTVESHRRALLQKTGAKTMVSLVVQAMRASWVSI